MNSAPAALAALAAPTLAVAGGPGANGGAPPPLESGADEFGVGFAGLLGPEVDAVSLDAGAAVAPIEPAAIAPPLPTPAPAPTHATPPPMTDPATTAVLNALALRVSTESNASAGPMVAGADGRTLPTGPAGQAAVAGGLGLALQALGSAIAQAAGAAAASPAPSNAGAKGGASAVFALPLKLATGSAVTTDVPLDDLMADLATPQSGGDAGSAPAGSAATTPGFLGSSTTPATLAPLAAPLATLANMVAALATPSTASPAETDLSLLAGVQAGVGVDASALSAATSSASTPVATSAASPLQPAAFQAFLRADGSLPQIAVPMDSPQWGNELSTRVVAMAREQFTEAEIRITPEELGPIEVKLRFDGDRVHAQFGAISPEAREALSANLHRLREMLAGEGLNLGQAFVGHHGADRQSGQPGAPGRSLSGGDAKGDESAVSASAPRPAATRVGLLDEFA